MRFFAGKFVVDRQSYWHMGGVVARSAITSGEWKTALSAAVNAMEVGTLCFDDEPASCRHRN